MKGMEQSQKGEEPLNKPLAPESFIPGFRLRTRLILEALYERNGRRAELLRRDERREEQG